MLRNRLQSASRLGIWLALAVALIVVNARVFAQAQTARQITTGTPITATLDSEAVAQVFTLTGSAGQTLALTATNTIGVPLAVLVTDAAGAPIGQGFDSAASGETLLSPLELPTNGIYYITVFKAAGVNSVNEVVFTLVVDVLTGDTAVEPTAAPSAAVTPNATTLGVIGVPEATVSPESPISPEAVISAEATPSPDATQEADSFAQVLTTSGMTVTLNWNSTDDLDLEVRDPVGGSLYWRTPEVASGGLLSPNVNQGCAAPISPAQETATWSPGGIPTGSYEIIIYFQQSCNNNAPASFTLSPIVDGVALPPLEATVLPSQIFVTSFVVAGDGTAAFTGSSGIEGEQTLPDSTANIVTNATLVDVNTSSTGFIGNDQPYQAYQIVIAQNDLITIAMEATSGSLDTYITLLDADGNIVRSNDDRDTGVTNSFIGGALISQPGTYTLVATRFAQAVGGTEGDYVLTISSEASNLPAEFADLPRGSIEVRLLWRTNADLQLLLRDPAGDAVFDDIPTIRSGGTLGAQGNVGCRVSEGTPFSYIYYPLDIPPRPGTYEVEVFFENECSDTTPVNLNLYIGVNGQEVFSDTAAPIFRERYLTSFTVNVDGSVTPSDGGIVTGVSSLDYQAELGSATPLLAGEALAGNISQDNKFDVFTFLGQANDVVNISMDNTSGTLDPTLYLIGPSGGLLIENDDAVVGENTNSLIADFTLPEDGTYIIIATHFGALYGGTTGTYQLTLTPRS